MHYKTRTVSRCALAAAAFASVAIPAGAREVKAQNAPSLTLSVTTTYPNNQLIYTGAATYSVSAPPAPWSANGPVTYFHRQTDTVNGVPSHWRQVSGGLSWNKIEGTPGTFQVYASVPLATAQAVAPGPGDPVHRQVYASVPLATAQAVAPGPGDPVHRQVYASVPLATAQAYNQPPQQFATVNTAAINVTVPPPDQIQLPKPTTAKFLIEANGGNVTSISVPNVTFGFPVFCKTFPVGNMFNASPYEDLTGMKYFGATQRTVRDARIRLGGIRGGGIFERKGFTVIPSFLPAFQNGGPQAGFVFVSYQQTLKLQILDYNGDPRIYPLGPSFSVTIKSTNGGTSDVNITFQ